MMGHRNILRIHHRTPAKILHYSAEPKIKDRPRNVGTHSVLDFAQLSQWGERRRNYRTLRGGKAGR